jgi:hypothetical protein
MTVKHAIIFIIILCFISISAVSASDDAITENITLANDEINLEVSNNQNNR